MALTKKGSLAFGINGSGLSASLSGITNFTSAEGGKEYVTNINAKDVNGEVAGHVYGNTKFTAKVEGYANALPALGDNITVGGVTVPAMSVNISSSNEDFIKVSASGEGFGL